jgi:hypothetical protein
LGKPQRNNPSEEHKDTPKTNQKHDYEIYSPQELIKRPKC